MIPIIGAILGLAGAILPELLKAYKDKQDKKHELEMFKLQIQWEIKKHELKLEQVKEEALIREEEAIRDYAPVYEPKPSGKLWYDLIMAISYAWNALVRPTVTYMAIGLYGCFKYAQFKIIEKQVGDVYQALTTVWNENDTMIVFTVITFWFGGRQILRSLGKVK